MYSHLSSARLAPKKANIIAKMVRGMPVPDAVELLRVTSKKGARMIEQLLRSAIANASHNAKQDAQRMIIKTIIVNQGTALRRGLPMARGRTRPIKKFFCHITLTLGFEGEPMMKDQAARSKMQTSTKSEEPNPKKLKAQSSKPKATEKKSSASSESSESSASPAPHSSKSDVGSPSF